MGTLLQCLQRLYSLDTLDSRLTIPSNTPIKSVSDSQSTTRNPAASKDARAQEIASSAQPSKWNTPEFYFYYFVFITVVPMMFKSVIDVSRGWYFNCFTDCVSSFQLRDADYCFIQLITLHMLHTPIYCLQAGFLDVKWYASVSHFLPPDLLA